MLFCAPARALQVRRAASLDTGRVSNAANDASITHQQTQVHCRCTCCAERASRTASPAERSRAAGSPPPTTMTPTGRRCWPSQPRRRCAGASTGAFPRLGPRSPSLVRTCFHPESHTSLHAPLCGRQPILMTLTDSHRVRLAKPAPCQHSPGLGRGEQSVSHSAAERSCCARQVLPGCAAARVAGLQADGRTAPRRGRSGGRPCS